MFANIIKKLDNKLSIQPQPYHPIEAVEAFRKVDRILDTAWLPGHIDTAESMMVNLLNRYNFTKQQRTSPLVVGMQERINTRREQVTREWHQNYA